MTLSNSCSSQVDIGKRFIFAMPPRGGIREALKRAREEAEQEGTEPNAAGFRPEPAVIPGGARGGVRRRFQESLAETGAAASSAAGPGAASSSSGPASSVGDAAHPRRGISQRFSELRDDAEDPRSPQAPLNWKLREDWAKGKKCGRHSQGSERSTETRYPEYRRHCESWWWPCSKWPTST